MKPSATTSRSSLLETRRQHVLARIVRLDRKIVKTELRLSRLTAQAAKQAA
jgi:hypothetical protein